MLYVWLCCEGWERFGPFRHVTFHTTVILDDEGNVIALRDDAGWHTPDENSARCWRTPMVTASARHPHPNRGVN